MTLLIRPYHARSAAVVLLSALFLVACNSEPSEAKGDGGGKKGGKGKGGGGPVPVVVAAAALRDVPIEIQVVGNVEAFATVSVRAQVSGQLTSVNFRDGDYVRKGDQLFTIDPRQIEGQLAQAEANLARSTAQLAQAQANLARDTAQEKYARAQAERTSQLAAEGVFSRDQMQQAQSSADALAQALAADQAAIKSAEAQIAADQATINNIKLQKSFTTVTAPVDGRTGNIIQRQGNIVTANNTELAIIHQIEPIYVSFAVPEARLSDVKRYFDQGGRLPVIAKAQDGSGAAEYGELAFIDNAVDMTTGTIRLRGQFQNSGRNLWPGQFANVTLQLTTRRGAVVVPNQAVQTGQDGTFVYVVNDGGTVDFRPVKVGPRIDLDLVIDEGLQPGEVVVTEGQLRLQPGSRVQTREAATSNAPPPAAGEAPAEFAGKGKGKGKGGKQGAVPSGI